MTAITGNQSANVSGTKYIDSRCIVDFRPNDDWKGEYGFDWYRRGDANENISGKMTATYYSNIVGKYTPQDPDYGEGTLNRKIGNIDYLNKLANDEYPMFKITGYDRTYLAPYISLYYMSINQWEGNQTRRLPNAMLYKKDGKYYQQDFCKSEATIKAIINAKNIEKIEFTCDKSLTVSPNVLTGIADGKSVKTITIRHNYAFSEGHQSIKAFAYHKDGFTITFAGQINVVKCEPKTVDICFVNVQIKIKKSISLGIPDNNFSDTQQKNLKRFFSQAHIIPNITTKSLSVEQEDIADHLTTKFITEDDEFFGKRRNVVLKYNSVNETIGSKLEQLFNKQYPSLTKSYKIFFIGEHGMRSSKGRPVYLGGHANGIPSKGLVIYKDPNESVVCHEILHCYGLYHSFSNNSKHTFEKFKTSNIMDYSTDTISLWRWQWNVIGNALDVKKV